MNELRQHKRSDKIKWAITFTAIILMAILIVGLCLQLFAADKYKPAEWFKKPEQETEQSQDSTVLSVVEERGLYLASARLLNSQSEENGISPQAESTYLITATLNPENPLDSTVNWSIAWHESAASTWAKNKSVSDYVKITVSSDTLSARVECLKSFGCTIVITATANSNAKAFATCMVNYIERVTALNSMSINGGFGFGRDLYCTYNSTLSDGTIHGTTTYSISNVEFSEGFVDAVYSDKLYELDNQERFDTTTLFDIFKTGDSSLNFHYNSVENILSFDGDTFAEVAMIEGCAYSFFDNGLAMCIQEGASAMFGISVTATTTYNGNVVSRVSKVFYPALDADSFIIVANSLNLSKNSLIF